MATSEHVGEHQPTNGIGGVLACLGVSGALIAVEPVTGLVSLAGCYTYYRGKKSDTKVRQAEKQKADAEVRASVAEDRAVHAEAEVSVMRSSKRVVYGLLAMTVVAVGVALRMWWSQRRRRLELEAQVGAANTQDVQDFIAQYRRENPQGGSPRSGLSSSWEGEPPAGLTCVITGELFRDPVICADGHTYEREAIQAWFARGYNTSPLTNMTLDTLSLTPNHSLRSTVEELSERQVS
eukprot:TRINITY_DN39793_c0_g1_i1.p1 TRINITY_DN39793_c0_g1~~TRINITY_DN39793_c0_g1_i1.p1  ORF type:complete len:237 (-),score=20.16 TRINITY_DN39793_c0_g1_i1:345-1055(-)